MPRLIDLSTGIEHQAVHEPWKPSIDRIRHDVERLEWMERSFGVDRSQLTQSGGLGPAFEEVTAITHCGTHVDAPRHYGPVSESRKAKTIDECPLEWFYGDGVRLDLRHKQPGERILVEDLERALEEIGHALAPREIVMLWTGRDKHLGSEEYFDQPG
jgi:kynurenine formamidase